MYCRNMSEINERNLAFAYDPMLREVGEYFVMKGEASTSMVQKVFSIGYNRAGRIMDQLEALGVVGEAKGSMTRKVLVADKTALNELLKGAVGSASSSQAVDDADGEPQYSLDDLQIL